MRAGTATAALALILAAALLPSVAAGKTTGTQTAADTGGYPNPTMPCIHPPYKTTGTGYWCNNYDWGPTRDGTQQSTYSARGYGYRNCTDWASWRLNQMGVPAAKLKGLGPGGRWAALAPQELVSATPAVGSAAVQVSPPGSYGHVAVVEAVSGTTITVSEYNKKQDGTYGTRTGTPASLGFTKFVHFERLIPSTPPRILPPPGPAPANCNITHPRSIQGVTRSEITFVNRSGATIDVFWLNYAGGRVFYYTLLAGQSYLQRTWLTHPWVAVDRNGACHGYTLSDTLSKTYTIN